MSPAKRGARARITYLPHLKCCTFQPNLPNFLVGALITEFEKRRESWFHEMLKSEGALPLGLRPPMEYRRKFLSRGPRDFGRREDLLCTFYDRETGGCRIWRHRGSVCTSFFCRSDLGPRGLRFWSLFGDYLHHVEMCLAEEALVHLDFTPRDLSRQLDALIAPKKKTGSSLWKTYRDRADLYRRTAEWVGNLSRQGFEDALGSEGLKKERKVLSRIGRIQLSRSQR